MVRQARGWLCLSLQGMGCVRIELERFHLSILLSLVVLPLSGPTVRIIIDTSTFPWVWLTKGEVGPYFHSNELKKCNNFLEELGINISQGHTWLFLFTF